MRPQLIAKELGEIEATLVMRFIIQEKKRKNDFESKPVSDELDSMVF